VLEDVVRAGHAVDSPAFPFEPAFEVAAIREHIRTGAVSLTAP
jgi:hypothetical protein